MFGIVEVLGRRRLIDASHALASGAPGVGGQGAGQFLLIE